MTIAQPVPPSSEIAGSTSRQGDAPLGLLARVPVVVGRASTSSAALIRRLPTFVGAVSGRGRRMMIALEALPDSTIRPLAAGLAGIGVGLHLGGAPKVMTAAGVAPALLVGAVVLLRASDLRSPAILADAKGGHA
jgi:hypothetical protein